MPCPLATVLLCKQHLVSPTLCVLTIMDLSPVTLAKILLPKTPLLLKTALLNTLSLSPNASRQDLRTDLTVSVIRELITKPDAIGKSQKGSLRDPGIKGKMWISKVTLPKPEDHEALTPRDALDIAIKEHGDGSETYTLPEMSAVEAEWTGYRSGVEGKAPRPDMPEDEQYKRLMSEVKSDVTILYFHGGAYLFVPSNPTIFQTLTPGQSHGSGIPSPPNLPPRQIDLWPLPLRALSPRAAEPVSRPSSRRPRRLLVPPITSAQFIPFPRASLQHRLRRRQRRRQPLPKSPADNLNPAKKGHRINPLPRSRCANPAPSRPSSKFTLV